jgi:chitin synthase
MSRYRKLLPDGGLSNRATAAKADDKGAQATVAGYMAFVLFSVAGLACAYSPIPCPAALTGTSFAVFRFIGSSAYLIIRLFAGE